MLMSPAEKLIMDNQVAIMRALDKVLFVTNRDMGIEQRIVLDEQCAATNEALRTWHVLPRTGR